MKAWAAEADDTPVQCEQDRGARVLPQGGGDQAFEGLAWYVAAAHQPVEDQSVDAGQQGVSAILDVRHAARGE